MFMSKHYSFAFKFSFEFFYFPFLGVLKDDFSLAREITHMLETEGKKTLNEDPMVEFEVSDSEDEISDSEDEVT